MKAIELFSGIGGFRVAADRLGLQTVWANDLSPKACTVYRDRFRSSNLREADFSDVKQEIPSHDLLTGGFPCQPFSSAGKKEGIRDSRGTLFEHIIDTLRTHRPRYFVLENVKRLLTMENGSHFATILSGFADLDYFVEWRLLNAMHFGLPQNRERVMIVGELTTHKGSQPVNEEYTPAKLVSVADLSSLKETREHLFSTREWRPISQHHRRFENWGYAWKGRFFATDLDRFSEASPLKPLSSILEPVVSDEFDFTETTLKWIHNNTAVNRRVNGVEILSNQRGGARMGYTIFGVTGVAPTLTSTTSRHYERYKVGDRYRRLTNVEYARIQGFEDDHCRAVSIYDQYSLFGNAVPPPMAEWVIRQLNAKVILREEFPKRRRNRSLFDYV